jgi:hypothetical protein
MCRVRNCHTHAPWSTAYICITIDDSCTDENGRYVDKPLTVRMVQWQPFSTRKPFDSKTPVCAACKRTNRTRSFCRERHKHRQLPWCTVYVLLSALDQTDPNTIVAGASKKVDSDEETSSDKPESKTDDVSAAGSETIASGDAESGDSDDINHVAESRTFLAKVSSRVSSIHWLDLSEFEPSQDPSAYQGEAPPDAATYGMPTSDHPYFAAHSMGYAALQHQNALKSNQQYFFQMQQRQHQQYPPPYHTPGYTIEDPIATAAAADESSITGQKRGAPGGEQYQAAAQHHQHQWAMHYYGQNGHPPPPGAIIPEMNAPNGNDRYQQLTARPAPAETNGDSDEVKRQRVV